MVAPALVLAHYFGGSARSWAPLRAELGNFACIAPSIPGFAGSPPLAGGPDLRAYAAWLEDLAPDGPWLAVGHSMGGKLALAAALRRPPGLAGLVLIASSPPTPEPMSDDDRRKSRDSFGDRDATTAAVREIAGGRLPADRLAAAIDDQLAADRQTWNWWLDRGSRDDISADTAGLDLPVLIVTGDRDDVLGPGVMAGVAANLRGRVATIPGGGHLVPLECPAAVAEAMRDFIAARR